MSPLGFLLLFVSLFTTFTLGAIVGDPKPESVAGWAYMDHFRPVPLVIDQSCQVSVQALGGGELVDYLIANHYHCDFYNDNQCTQFKEGIDGQKLGVYENGHGARSYTCKKP